MVKINLSHGSFSLYGGYPVCDISAVSLHAVLYGHRCSIRLPDYVYSQPSAYFIFLRFPSVSSHFALEKVV